MTLIVDNLVFYAVIQRTGSIGWSMLWARFVALFASFFFNRHAVFKFHGSPVWALARFVALVAGLGTVAYFATSFLSDTTGIKPTFVKLFVEGVLFVASFTLNRLFVFRASAGEADRGREELASRASLNER